jgi:predicted small secreted protein
MKMKIVTLVVLLSLAITSCNFSKSIKKDLVSGLLTTGDGLTCDNVYLTINDKNSARTTFIYGEEFLMNFSNIGGFKKENENVFPGMQIIVISSTGDTVMLTKDLYSDYSNGLKLSPLLLTADITVASPIKSKGEYFLHVNLWDKKGTGKYTAKLEFKVIPNEQIVKEANNVTYNEIYLFSKERNKVIPDNKIRFNENTYLIFEGLSGFKEENGMVFPGLSLKATDKAGNMVLDFNDLFADYTQSGLAVPDFKAQVSSHFKLTGSDFKNPMHCELIIWDKKSDARIKVSADLIIE